MTGLIIIFHVLICIFLTFIILIQSGRGGGLTEQFAAAESVFGSRTNSFLVKTTTVLAVLFFVTCVSLTILSTKQEKSVMQKRITIPINTSTDLFTEPAGDADLLSGPAENLPGEVSPEMTGSLEPLEEMPTNQLLP